MTIVFPDVSRETILTGFGMLSAAIGVSVRAYLAWRRERAAAEQQRIAAHDMLVDRIVALVEKNASAVATSTEVLRTNNERLNDLEMALKVFRNDGHQSPIVTPKSQ